MSDRPLRAGVIAAGHGERLRRDSATLKPLVRVGDRALIEHVLTSIAEAEASDVVVIVNEASAAVRRHVTDRAWPFRLHWIVETTPSSMHSFLRVVETLAEKGDAGPFLISTVDTVAGPGAYKRFMSDVRQRADADVTLALTAPGGDETPLLVQTSGPRVVAIGASAERSPFATAGYYAVRASILADAAGARRAGVGALRHFLARLLERGYRIDGIPVPESIDVDRPADVQAAEALLRRETL